MSAKIPQSHIELLTGPYAAVVCTLMPDGTPQSSVVWCNFDGEHVLFNTAVGRQKDKNLRARPDVSLLVVDPNNMYRYIEVRGPVTLTTEGAVAHIDALAKLYRGVESYYGGVTPASLAAKETRIICKLTPTKVHAGG